MYLKKSKTEKICLNLSVIGIEISGRLFENQFLIANRKPATNWFTLMGLRDIVLLAMAVTYSA